MRAATEAPFLFLASLGYFIIKIKDEYPGELRVSQKSGNCGKRVDMDIFHIQHSLGA